MTTDRQPLDHSVVEDLHHALTTHDYRAQYEHLRASLIKTMGYEAFRAHQEEAFRRIVIQGDRNLIQTNYAPDELCPDCISPLSLMGECKACGYSRLKGSAPLPQRRKR